MKRYIDAVALLKRVKSKRLIFEESTPVEEAIAEQVSVFEEAIIEAHTADVVPKSEVEQLTTLNSQLEAKVWEERKEKSEVVQEVIDFTKVKIAELEDHTSTEELDRATDLVKWILAGVISDLKKKYTEGNTNEKDM